jgi:hypothetical protein
MFNATFEAVDRSETEIIALIKNPRGRDKQKFALANKAAKTTARTDMNYPLYTYEKSCHTDRQRPKGKIRNAPNKVHISPFYQKIISHVQMSDKLSTLRYPLIKKPGTTSTMLRATKIQVCG